MRLNRFFSDFDFSQKTLRLGDREIGHQIKNVLRLGIGEEIVLVSRGQEAVARIIEYGKDFVASEILSVKENQNESARRVILYCSILKRENFELVAQKATEVGVSEIVPMICERTIKTGLKGDRLRKIIKEAAEQSGRGVVPVLRESADIKEAIKEADNNDINILFDVSGADFSASDVKKSARVGIFIGPEGGWSDFELDLARQRKFKIASLGKLTLRGETAAIVATYLAGRE